MSFGSEPRGVGAGNGWAWLRDAFGLVFKNPFSWVITLILGLILTVAVLLIPIPQFLVGISVALMWFVFYGGLMLGCDAASKGDGLKVGHLFAGFGENAASLLGLGAFYVAAGFALSAVAFLPTVGLAGVSILFLGAEADPAQMAEMVVSLEYIIGLLVAMGLSVPLLMAIWFAPALVVLQDCKPVDALRTSFTACLKNVVPFLVFGIASLLIGILCTIPLGLGLLIFMPAVVASEYTSFVDVFAATG